MLLSMVLLVAASPDAAVIVRQDDPVSADAAITLAQSNELNFWLPSEDHINDAAVKLHLMPYYLAQGDERLKLDGEVKRLLESALNKPPLEAVNTLRDALSLAYHLPVVPPDPRDQKILLAQKRLIEALTHNGQDASAVVEEFVLRQPLDAPIDLDVQNKIVARLRRQPLSGLSVNAQGGEISVDGQDFDKTQDYKLLPGVHEVVVRFGATTGLLHRVELNGKNLRLLTLSPALERSLAFTPKGFVLRHDAPLSPDVAALVSDGTNAAAVWLVEKKSDAPPALLVTVSQNGKNHVAQVNLPNDAPLTPGDDIDGRKRAAHAIIEAAQVAVAEKPLALQDFEVTRGEGGMLTLLPRAAMAPQPLYKKWWLWTAVGAVVAAGTVTAVVLVTRDSGVTFYSKTSASR